MPLQGKQCSELFRVFLELHTRGGNKYEQARALPCLLPVGYLDTTLLLDTNKVLKGSLDLGEFMRWVGCWFYMACWVGIPDRRDWWSVTPPEMHRGSPLCLNGYMPCYFFDEIIASFIYTNREVQYEDGLFHMRQMEEARKKNGGRFQPTLDQCSRQ